MTRDELIAFENEIAGLFNAGKIPYPVHLSGGNEDALIDIFKNINRRDWVCGAWRMHYQCLLHGVPPDELKTAILQGESIALRFPKYRIVCSAIAGGIAPIAVGIALSIKREGNGEEQVYCFIGDMAAEMGIVHECVKYSSNHELPIKWIIEDNKISVCTPTVDAWGHGNYTYITRYYYKSVYPHAGAGVRVQF